MEPLTLNGYFKILNDSDAYPCSNIANFENTTFGEIKNIKVHSIQAIEMISIIEKLGEKFNFDTTEFYGFPETYTKLLSKLSSQFNKKGLPLNPRELLKYPNILSIGLSEDEFSVRLGEIVKLDKVNDKMTMKYFILQIGPSFENSLCFMNYLRSTAIVFAKLMESDASLSIFMILLLCPLQKLFTNTNLVHYVKIWGYCGPGPLPEDLATFKSVESEMAINPIWDLKLSYQGDLTVDMRSQVMMALLMDPHKLICKEETLNKLKIISKKHKCMTKSTKSEMDLQLSGYTHKIGNATRYALSFEDLPEIRQHLVNSMPSCFGSIKAKQGRKVAAMEKYLKGLFARAFQNISKWEIALKIWNNIFTQMSTTNDLDNSLASTSDYSSQPSSSNTTMIRSPQTPTVGNTSLYMVSDNSFAPSYELIPIGPAPRGWQNDPAWQRNKFCLNNTIMYNGHNYHLSN